MADSQDFETVQLQEIGEDANDALIKNELNSELHIQEKEDVKSISTSPVCSWATAKVFYFAVVASLSSFQYGTSTVFSSPLLVDLQQSNLTQWKEGFSTDECTYQILIGPISPIAAIVGGLVTIPLTAVTGLVTAMILTAGVYSVGWTMLGGSYFITSPYAFRGVLLAGRALTGLAMGLTVPIVPVYIAEIASPNIRGRLTMVFQILLTLGLFTAYLFGGLIGYWKTSFIFSAVSVLHVVLLFTVKESPVRSRNPLKNARSLWQKLRNHRNVVKSMPQGTAWKYIKVTYVGTCVLAFQQITGLSAILYYVGPILESAGWSEDAALSANTAAALSIGVVQISGSVCTFFVVDRIGRRILLFFGALGTTVANVGLAVYFGVAFGFLPNASNAAANESMLHSSEQSSCFQPPVSSSHISSVPGLVVVPVAFIVLFFVSFSLSWASISWIVAGELFPKSIKGVASGFSGSVNRASVVVVTFAFPPLTRHIGFAIPFFVFAGISVLAAIFVVFCIPETCQLSLDEIGDMDLSMSKNAKQFLFLLKTCFLCRLSKKCYNRMRTKVYYVFDRKNETHCNTSLTNFIE